MAPPCAGPSPNKDLAKMTRLALKTVECQCGNTFETDKHKSWCQGCCRPVFYHEKDQRNHKFSNYYMYTMIAAAIMFVSYLFIEMIARPLLAIAL
jgi:hypothetical protein